MPASTDRDHYHHGDLFNALLDAAEALIAEKSPDAVTIAALTRREKVSSTAFYRHFNDLPDLFGHLSARGFAALTRAMRAAIDQHPVGSIEALIAGGQAYVAFVSSRPALFEVMWGAIGERYAHDRATGEAESCYGVFRQTLGALMAARRIDHLDAYAFGTPLWAIVHGVANLTLGRNRYLEREPAQLDALIDSATRTYLAGAQPRAPDEAGGVETSVNR